MSDVPAQLPFELKGFYGAVHLLDWISGPDGNSRKVIVGEVSIYQDVELAGFRARGAHDSNWVALVDGPTQRFAILGCQVRAVAIFPPEAPVTSSDWWVLP